MNVAGSIERNAVSYPSWRPTCGGTSTVTVNSSPDATPGTTAIPMPGGLVEGTETILLLTAMLILPGAFVLLAWVMAGLVVVTIFQRLRWAVRHL